jgi:hypothetical protein
MEEKKINKIEVIAIASADLKEFDSDRPSEEDEKNFIEDNAIGSFNELDTRTNLPSNSEGGKESPQ